MNLEQLTEYINKHLTENNVYTAKYIDNFFESYILIDQQQFGKIEVEDFLGHYRLTVTRFDKEVLYAQLRKDDNSNSAEQDLVQIISMYLITASPEEEPDTDEIDDSYSAHPEHLSLDYVFGAFDSTEIFIVDEDMSHDITGILPNENIPGSFIITDSAGNTYYFTSEQINDLLSGDKIIDSAYGKINLIDRNS